MSCGSAPLITVRRRLQRALACAWCATAEKVKKYTFDFSYDSFVPRDQPSYASQETVWKDIGVGVLANAYNGA